ncbi:MAG: FkbM family methyltransferase [Chloroflexi bacterium]|nr:MAG: FkbM family methyltransferase [Chloroflexota bacterium]
MRILWHSSSIYNRTGYGVQTNAFVKLLQKDGHTVGVVAMDKDDATAIMYDGVAHLPGGWQPSPITNNGHSYGWQGMVEYARRGKPDLIITLMDLWAIPMEALYELQSLGVPWMAIGPIDHDPIPGDILSRFEASPYPMAMSLFGKDQLEKHGVKARYFPHGVDTAVFAPRPPEKRLITVDDKTFVVGTVAANIDRFFDRKGFQQSFEAFSIFHKRHPDSAYYIHSELSGQFGGMNLGALADMYGIKIIGPDVWQYYTGEMFGPEQMARIYNAFDVFILLSKGEGFGVPLIEAQACGVPVITTDFAAQGTLCGAGWKVPIIAKQWTPNNSFYGIADVKSAVDALEKAYQAWRTGYMPKLEKKARDFALGFDFQTVYQTYLKPVIEEIAAKPKHDHEWSETGLTNPDGTVSAYCYKCNDELIINPKGVKRIVPNGYKPAFDFVEPDHAGSVGKIIAREIVRDYKLDGLGVKNGDVIVDIGAHIGLVSIYLAKMYPKAKVYAYEPIPENYEYLLKNIELAGVKNVIPHNLAVTKDGRDVKIGGDLEKNNGASSMYLRAEAAAQVFEVKSISAGDVLKETGRIKLLKIDAEFAEYEILPNMDLSKVEFMRGEFHRGLENETPEKLVEHCAKFMDPKKIKVSVS